MVTGYTPFESEYHSETVTNITTGQPKFSYSKWSKYNPQLQNFVSKLLVKVEKRITIEEARAHLWVNEIENKSKSSKKLLKKSSSFSLNLH